MEPTDQQALALIDHITGDDFCADLEMRDFSTPLTGDLKTAFEKLARIYVIAHSMDKSHSCFQAHENWRATIAPELAEMQGEDVTSPPAEPS
jgi:hypothetical protein